MKKVFYAFVIILSTVLTACTMAQVTAPDSATSLPVLASATPRPTILPTSSSTPSPTVTQTATLAPSLTATTTPTPTLSFAGFQVQFVEYRSYGMLIGFLIPGVKTPYRLEVNKQVFTCDLQANIADRLYCKGVYFPAGSRVTLTFYLPDGKNPIYQANYVVTPLQTATIDPYTLTSASCPVRGINASCETENRIADNGKCIVSTCVDSCGYWYSIDTCYYKTPFIADKKSSTPKP